jgi:glucokinase
LSNNSPKLEANVLALEIGGTHVRAALAKGDRIFASRVVRWPKALLPEGEVDFVAEVALALVREHNLKVPVAAAGVSAAALLDRTGTVVQWPNRPSWRGLRLRNLLHEHLEMQIVITDDANAAALAEAALGAGQEYQDLLVMTVGTGVGAGLILNKTLFSGRNGWAGELGHLVIQRDGPPCPCGKRGCLQMMASGRALERIAAAYGLDDAEAVTEAAARGETWAVEALAESGRWLGLAAANVVDLLDLEAVIVGGGLSVLGPPWWSSLEETLQANLINASHKQVALHRAALGDPAGLLGAVLLAQQLSGETN